MLSYKDNLLTVALMMREALVYFQQKMIKALFVIFFKCLVLAGFFLVSTPLYAADGATSEGYQRLLFWLTQPNVIYLLLMVGLYGLFFELLHPGFIIPGTVGAIALLLALYGLQGLPINYLGLVLIIVGFVFIVAEAFVSSFGLLGLGGTVAFIAGSLWLVNSEQVATHISITAIVAMAVVNIVFLLGVSLLVVKAQRQPKLHGLQLLVGKKGYTLSLIDKTGQIRIDGEIWQARSLEKIGINKPVQVIAVSGLTLVVEELLQGE